MSAFLDLQNRLENAPKRWLVTGVAGFIGSNVLEALLKLNQRVLGLDNYSTGKQGNLQQVRELVPQTAWGNFEMLEGNIADLATCERACQGIDYVVHLAALGSVPGSIADPLGCHQSNVTGFINVLEAARKQDVKRLVYASSSAVYGEEPGLPKTEDKMGRPLSPYAASKATNELYAQAYSQAYGFRSVGLRYFNVFGPRQDPDGAYAAVIPKWIASLLSREPVFINGDGETTRDFCYVSNVVQANLLAATTENPEAFNQVFNVALGERTSLNQLFQTIQAALRQLDPGLPEQQPVYRAFREGDIRHSVASIDKARRLLGFEPTHRIDAGLALAMDWYRTHLR
jgi:UDP-N-acetylglucosamine/UDP-N-acetylgalactosamine 4-epimerase